MCKAEDVIDVLKITPLKERHKVKAITLDMAGSMGQIAKQCFPKATRVIDRIHVQELVLDALQEIRIKHRWYAIDEETSDRDNAKWDNKIHTPLRFDNGDTKKQLLARSRYLLFKSADKWSPFQKQRDRILFAQYPDIKKAFDLTHDLRLIFLQNKR